MYSVTVNLEKRVEKILFYSDWAARLKAEEWSKCYDVVSTMVMNEETGEIGYEFKKGVCTLCGVVDF